MRKVCPQEASPARRGGDLRRGTNVHKRRDEAYFRRDARASPLPRGSKGHKREGSFQHRTQAGAQERERAPCPVLLRAWTPAARLLRRTPEQAMPATRAERARRPPQRAARTSEAVHARRVRSARATPAFPDPMRWQAILRPGRRAVEVVAGRAGRGDHAAAVPRHERRGTRDRLRTRWRRQACRRTLSTSPTMRARRGDPCGSDATKCFRTRRGIAGQGQERQPQEARRRQEEAGVRGAAGVLLRQRRQVLGSSAPGSPPSCSKGACTRP
jgi:hypothetical protein